MNENEEREPLPKGMSSEETYSHTPLDTDRPDIIKWQLDPEEILDELERKFRGEVWDSKLNAYVIKRKPLMNDKGINSIMSLLEPRVSKIIILSNLDEKDIYNIIKDVMKNIIILIASKRKDFAIEKEYRSVIRSLIDDVVFATLSRAKNGGERKLIYTSEKRVETFADHSKPQQKKNFFGGLIR